MDSDILVGVIIAIAALAGAFFTAVPIVPGCLFPPLGAIACGFTIGWDELPWWSWVLQAVLVAAYLVLDNVAQAIGVGRAGGSRSAMVGGAVGVFAGPIVLAFVIGPFALLLGPPIGAVVGTILGEERARRRAGTERVGVSGYRRLSVGALVAYVVGTALKLAIVTAQVVLLFVVTR